MELTPNRASFCNVRFAFLVFLLLLGTLSEAKVLNCRPLPQCCRRYVFSPACRGVAAKRSEYSALKANDDILRDPRFSLDTDYANDNGYRNSANSLSNEDVRSLSYLLKNTAEDNDY